MNILESVGFKTSESADDKSLLQRITPTPNYKLNPSEQIAIYEAFQIFNSIEIIKNLNNYIFFKRDNSKEKSIPIAYVIDCYSECIDEISIRDSIAMLRHNLWLDGRIKLLYVNYQSHLSIYSLNICSIKKNKNQLEYIYKATKEIRNGLDIERDSLYRLLDGTFFEDDNNKEVIPLKKSSHEILINKVIDADEKLDGKHNIIARRLLLVTILIKYLEDRGVFPNEWFKKIDDNCNCYVDILKKKDVAIFLRLLNHLEDKFNGGIFSLKDTKSLESITIENLLNVVNAKEYKGQWYFWDFYDFKHIPIEVLSHIYQHFAEDGKGAIFTPPLLVDIILNEVLPYNNSEEDKTIFDPTCGSGIFLVLAFKRLVYKNMLKNNFTRLLPCQLKKLLRKTIFGVELQTEAVDLTCFSLALAICDALQPNVIWDNLEKFDDLRNTNIFEGDFAEKCRTVKEVSGNLKGFDIIVGNPPFQSELTDKMECDKKNRSIEIPDKQKAYYILEKCLSEYLTDNSILCMIQPSGFLYNINTRGFRNTVLEKFNLAKVLDFTSIQQNFKNAHVKIIALKFENKNCSIKEECFIEHITFRKTKSLENKIYFELDYYDYNYVSLEEAKKYDFVWNANLFGGGRLFYLAKKILDMPKLSSYISSENMKIHDGYKVGNRKHKATWLKGVKSINDKALKKGTFEIDTDRLSIIEEEYFETKKHEKCFLSPIMIIRKNLVLTFGIYDSVDTENNNLLAYSNSFVGIPFNTNSKDIILNIAKNIKKQKELIEASWKLFSPRIVSQRSTTLYKQDIENIPLLLDENNFKLLNWEKELIADLNKYMFEYVENATVSKLTNKVVTEKDLIKYDYTFLRLMKSIFEGSNLITSKEYGGLRIQIYSLYKNVDTNFQYGSSDLEYLRNEVYRNYGDSLFINRLVIINTGEIIVLVKPNKLRYWIPSVAIRDFDKIISDAIGEDKSNV